MSYSHKYASITSTRSRQTWIEFHSSNIDNWHKMENGAKIKKRKCGNILCWKKMNINTHSSVLCKCHKQVQVSIFQHIWNEKLLAGLLRKKRRYTVGRKTCSQGITALGFIFATILELISTVFLSRSVFHRHNEGCIKLAAWWGQHV